MNTRSPWFEAHQEALKLIYTFTTTEQFDSTKSILETDPRFQILKPTQIATLLWVAENQRRLNIKSSNPPITIEDFSPRVKEIQEEYREVDIEQFGVEEVTLPTPVPPVEEVITPTPTPVPPAEEPTKRTRRTKAETEEQPKTNNSYTLSRRVNLPIEWVQYSNNEFTVSVTSSSKEEATQELNALLDGFPTSQWLIRKSIAENTINELRAQLLAEQAKKATTPIQAVDTELQEKHQRLRDMMNFIYNNSSNKEEFIQLKNTFTNLP